MALIASPALAQDIPTESSEEELREEGWAYESEDTYPGSVTGGILALTVGIIAHGTGHLYAGDLRTGKFLLIAEGVSIGLVGLGVLVESLSNSDSSLAPLYESLIPLGLGLFVSTWLFDVIGTFKGTGLSFASGYEARNQLSLSARYTHLSVEGLPLQHASQLDLRLDYFPIYLYPRAAIGIAHEFLQVGSSFGVRIGLGRRQSSFFYLGGDADRFDFSDLGFSYWSVLGAIGLSIDMGDVFSHLDGLVLVNELGGGTQLHSFDFDDSIAVSRTPFLVFETSLRASPVDPLSIEFGWQQRPDQLVGDSSVFGTLTYAPTPRWELFADARVGRGLQLFTGTAFYFIR